MLEGNADDRMEYGMERMLAHAMPGPNARPARKPMATPNRIETSRRAASRGVAPHVVMRGYGGRLAGPVRVDPKIHDAVSVGDEALLAAGSGTPQCAVMG